MRRTLKRTTFFGVRSRGYRCRLERLESRSMMAADIVEAAFDVVPDEPTLDERIEEPAVDSVDGWDGCVLQVCELQELDGWFCEFQFIDEPVFIDDSYLMVTDPVIPAFEPVDIRVQFVSSESDSNWAAYYYTVGADGVVQGVSVVASYDEPTIAAFVAEHADDPSVQISDYGDGWWIGCFPLELAPPVPDAYVFFGGTCGGGMMAWGTSADPMTTDGTDGADVVGDWSWDGSHGMSCGGWSYAGGVDAGDWTSYADDCGMLYACGSWNDWTAGDGTDMPLFYARGAGMAESFGDDLAAYPMTDDVDPATAVLAEDFTVVEPLATNPRAAAFADMGTMAAAATALQSASTDTPPIGGRRRR